MKRTRILIVVFIGVIAAFASFILMQTPLPYIDFAKVELKPAFAGHSGDQPLRMAVSSILPPQESIIYYRQIADCLAAEVNRPVVVVQRPTYAELHSLLVNGGADIAFFSTGTYISFASRSEFDPLVVQERQGSNSYESYLIVHRDANAETLSDLRSKSFAFCDPLSYSGYLTLNNTLKQQNTTPESFFNHYFYTYNHSKSLHAVANKVVDGAAIDSLVFLRALSQNPEVAETIKVIGVLGRAGTGPVVARKNLDSHQKDLIRKTFLTIHTNPQAAKALQGLMIDRFVPFERAQFAPVLTLSSTEASQ